MVDDRAHRCRWRDVREIRGHRFDHQRPVVPRGLDRSGRNSGRTSSSSTTCSGSSRRSITWNRSGITPRFCSADCCRPRLWIPTFVRSGSCPATPTPRPAIARRRSRLLPARGRLVRVVLHAVRERNCRPYILPAFAPLALALEYYGRSSHRRPSWVLGCWGLALFFANAVGLLPGTPRCAGRWAARRRELCGRSAQDHRAGRFLFAPPQLRFSRVLSGPRTIHGRREAANSSHELVADICCPAIGR